MTTKLAILLSVGGLALLVLVGTLARAWRHQRNHPEEFGWPYEEDKCGETTKEEKK